MDQGEFFRFFVFYCFCCFCCFSPLCIDLLTDKVQPLSRNVAFARCTFGPAPRPTKGTTTFSTSTPTRNGCRVRNDFGVGTFFVIHVGGTRCVPSRTDDIMNIHARITLTVACIRTCIFDLFLVCVNTRTRRIKTNVCSIWLSTISPSLSDFLALLTEIIQCYPSNSGLLSGTTRWSTRAPKRAWCWKRRPSTTNTCSTISWRVENGPRSSSAKPGTSLWYMWYMLVVLVVSLPVPTTLWTYMLV